MKCFLKLPNKLDFIDVFCETGYFSVEETEQIMEAEFNLA
jgi:imidazolonepropionase-like amidohydrolase